MEQLSLSVQALMLTDNFFYATHALLVIPQEAASSSRITKKWEVHSEIDGIEVSYRKVNDGYPLRLWRSVAEVCASPDDIIKRMWNERYVYFAEPCCVL